MGKSDPFKKAEAIFRQRGGLLRTKEAIRLGIQPRTLYAMRDAAALEQVSRGFYRLVDMPPLGNPDLVAVSLKIPRGVVCLISALAFHEITTQVPHEVHVALEQGVKKPRLTYPPIRVVWLSGRAFFDGLQTHRIDGVPVRVYSPEKTVADCFKFRNKIGLDVAVEALRLCRQRKRSKVEDLLRFARSCRVEKVMRPYLEAIL